MDDLQPYLTPGEFVDSDHPDVRAFGRNGRRWWRSWPHPGVGERAGVAAHVATVVGGGVCGRPVTRMRGVSPSCSRKSQRSSAAAFVAAGTAQR